MSAPSMKSNPIKTAIIMVAGFLVLYYIFEKEVFVHVATGLAIVAVVSKKLMMGIEWLWFKLAQVLSFIVPNILLSLIFFLFLFPIALLSKLFGNKNSLQRKNKSDSLFIHRNFTYTKESLSNPW